MKPDLITRLEGVVKSIENRIGRHPEADTVQEAIDVLTFFAAQSAETEPKVKSKKTA